MSKNIILSILDLELVINGILYLEGEPRKYTKPYVVVFEITNPDEYSQVHYNGERIVTFGYDFRYDSSVNN